MISFIINDHTSTFILSVPIGRMRIYTEEKCLKKCVLNRTGKRNKWKVYLYRMFMEYHRL